MNVSMQVLEAPPRRIESASSVEDLLARLLCYGARLPADLPDSFIRKYDLEPGFVQGTVLVLGGVKPVNTAVFEAMTHQSQAVPLTYERGSLYTEFNGKRISCNLLEQPPAVSDVMGGYGRIGAYVRLHAPHGGVWR